MNDNKDGANERNCMLPLGLNETCPIEGIAETYDVATEGSWWQEPEGEATLMNRRLAIQKPADPDNSWGESNKLQSRD